MLCPIAQKSMLVMVISTIVINLYIKNKPLDFKLSDL